MHLPMKKGNIGNISTINFCMLVAALNVVPKYRMYLDISVVDLGIYNDCTVPNVENSYPCCLASL